jgi:hypothetical protein
MMRLSEASHLGRNGGSAYCLRRGDCLLEWGLAQPWRGSGRRSLFTAKNPITLGLGAGEIATNHGSEKTTDSWEQR